MHYSFSVRSAALLALAMRMLMAAPEKPPRTFLLQNLPGFGTGCAADAINDLGEVVVTCSTGHFQTASYLWDGWSVRSGELGFYPPSSGCLFYSTPGFSNSRQQFQVTNYLSNCGFGGGWSIYGNVVSSHKQYETVFFYIGEESPRLNGSGRLVYGDRVWMGPSDRRRVPGLGANLRLRDLNDSMQAIYKDGSKWYRVNVISGGVDELPGFEGSIRATLNQRGWVAAVNGGWLGLWDGGKTELLATAPANSRALMMNNHAWIVGNSDAGFWLWDGMQIQLFSSLLPEVKVINVAGITDEGKIALTLEREGIKSAAIFMPADLLEPPAEILKPEAGPELEGHGELLGCDGFSGWVRDSSRPDFEAPLEVYEGTRLFAAGLANKRQPDGSYLFKLAIPPQLFDGQPHFVNVRFGGTATAVDQAWGVVQCDPRPN